MQKFDVPILNNGQSKCNADLFMECKDTKILQFENKRSILAPKISLGMTTLIEVKLQFFGNNSAPSTSILGFQNICDQIEETRDEHCDRTVQLHS